MYLKIKFHYSRSELLKTQLKKEQLETEIEILENKAKLKRHELKHSAVTNSNTNTNMNHHLDYDVVPNRLSGVEANLNLKSTTNKSLLNHVKSGYNYDEVSLNCFFFNKYDM